MYVTVSGRGKSRVIQFVEQHRIPKTNKKKTVVIKTIGNYEEMIAEDPDIMGKLRQEAKRLTEEKRLSNKPITVELSNQLVKADFEGENLYHIGHSVILGIWQDLKLDRFFENHCTRRNAKELIQAIQGLVIHRMTYPSSILRCHKDLERFIGLPKPSLDLFYEALDVMAEVKDDLIDHLNKQLSKKTKRKDGIAYYDVTTYACESTQQGELRLFGFSKDHKNNEVQVVLGLLIDSNAIPVSYQLFPGNTMDQSTLQDAVKDLKKRYQMEKIVVVADRGLNGKDNLQYLCQEGHDFVIAYTLKRAPAEIQALALSHEGWTTTQVDKETGEILFKEKCVEYDYEINVELSEEEKKGLKAQRGRPRKYKRVKLKVNIHLTWSAKRAAKDFKDRQRVIDKVAQNLQKPSQIKAQMKRGRNQYIKVDIDTEEAELDQDRISQQAQYDGLYAIVTNQLDYTTDKVVDLYSGLWKIEESFRVSKTDLMTRPMFVWTDDHIRGHFSYCYLALTMLRYSQYLLRTEGDLNVSAGQLMNSLSDPVVAIIGNYPTITLMLFRMNRVYFSLSKILDMGEFRENMTMSQFKKATKLDVSLDPRISGQN